MMETEPGHVSKRIHDKPVYKSPIVSEKSEEGHNAEIAKANVIELGLDGSQSTKPFPSTPSARLPLLEVSRNTSRNNQSATLATTPEEYIGWRTILSPKGTGPLEFIGTKKRKRTRSSSPLHSSQGDAGQLSGKPVAYSGNANNLLQTPRVDPAADLWTKYTADKVNVDAELKARPLKSVSLVRNLSPDPRGEALNGKVGGLRRWASCGVEWPMSRAKRRKTKAASRTEQVEISYERMKSQQNNNAENVITSKLGSLIERMQETLAATSALEAVPAPSSSSPLPKTGEAQADSRSPCRLLGCGGQLPDGSNNHEGQSRIIRCASPRKGQETSDGCDVEIRNNCRGRSLLHVEAAKAVKEVAKSESDDFSEEGIFAGELESFASLFDNRPDNIPGELPSVSNEVEKSLTGTIITGQAGRLNAATLLSSDDDYGGDDIDAEQCAVVEALATQKVSDDRGSQPASEELGGFINRYRISKVFDGTYAVNNHNLPEKILVLEGEDDRSIRAINLRQSWYDTPCEAGFYVHVTGDRKEAGLSVIDDIDGILVLHPDCLISATSIADSFGCMRRAVLQDRVKATSSANVPQVLGHILHELFQKSLKSNRWDKAWMESTLSALMPNYFESIIAIGMSVDSVQGQLKEKVERLQSWANIYVGNRPQPDAFLKDRGDQKTRVSISTLLDVEEHVWSPKFGIKGNIDATVEATTVDSQGQKNQIIPLELKTGRKSGSVSHQAQTALYTLLLSNRYDVDIAFGVLYYLESSETIRIPAVRRELMQMIIRRNELAFYLRTRSNLPPILNNSHMCRKCYAQTSCFIYHKLGEDGNGDTLAPKAEYTQLVRNLTAEDQAFFRKWDALLTKEESEMMKFRRELWTMTSKRREKVGRCFSNVVIESGSASEKPDGSRISRFLYSFVKAKGAEEFSFLDSQISVGEPIVVSDERGHFALANGYATSVQKHKISVAVDRELKSIQYGSANNIKHKQQALPSYENSLQEKKGFASARCDDSIIFYRVDKDEFSNGMALVRTNLIQIMLDEVFRARALRSLVVHRRPPLFSTDEDGPSSHSECTYDMNSDQRAAVDKVTRAKDYAIVLGMPGTGKTTTIAYIIKYLVSNGKSVLLTSYTHTAVDNILLKLRDTKISILRLGAQAKIHSQISEFATLAATPKRTLEEVKRSWFNPPVVATTCLGINHQIFAERVFDYCIVDEASQITLPVCLGPIRMAQTFVLVGDHYQLPPLVQNKEAIEGGLDISLFKLLSEAHPRAVVTLEHQYRMCADIMLLANTLIYDGRLKCGNDDVAQKKLQKIDFHGLQTFHNTAKGHRHMNASQIYCQGTSRQCWLQHIISPEARVRFLDTDPLMPLSLEGISGQRIVNQVEATLTSQLVTSLISVGVSGSDIGVITFYRSQLALLKQTVQTGTVEMYTADRFQGRDKEIIIVSCVRSNCHPSATKGGLSRNQEDTGQIGDLLRDWRRINVAITRARSKLIIIGSVRTLRIDNVIRKLIDLCAERGWLYNLPRGAIQSHTFPEIMGSQEKSNPSSAIGSQDMLQQQQQQQQQRKKTKARTVLGATQGKAVRSIPLVKGSPQKLGQLTTKSVIGSRPVLKDIVNEILDESIE